MGCWSPSATRGQAQGIYAQTMPTAPVSLAIPMGGPISMESPTTAGRNLVYHVLVNGMVEVPLLLTLSDVGEQMAWNGFLALRDTERAFELSVKAWNQLLKAGRLWTPDPNLNQAIQVGQRGREVLRGASIWVSACSGSGRFREVYERDPVRLSTASKISSRP